MALTRKRLRELLRYSPTTGIFTWRVDRVRNKVLAGMRAGCVNAEGYMVICIDRKIYTEHRLAWFYVHGEWPGQLDHENDKKGDNRYDNLREATQSQNNHARPKPRHNTSGVVGVSWNRFCNRWVAHISVNGKSKHLGLFTDIASAKAVREAAARKYFGDFARMS